MAVLIPHDVPVTDLLVDRRVVNEGATGYARLQMIVHPFVIDRGTQMVGVSSHGWLGIVVTHHTVKYRLQVLILAVLIIFIWCDGSLRYQMVISIILLLLLRCFTHPVVADLEFVRRHTEVHRVHVFIRYGASECRYTAARVRLATGNVVQAAQILLVSLLIVLLALLNLHV